MCVWLIAMFLQIMKWSRTPYGQKISVHLDPGTNRNWQVISAQEMGRWYVLDKAEVVILYQIELHALLLLFCCFCSQDTHRVYLISLALTLICQPPLICVKAANFVSPRICCLLPGPRLCLGNDHPAPAPSAFAPAALLLSDLLLQICSMRLFHCSDYVTALFKALCWLHCIQQNFCLYFNPLTVLPKLTSPSWFCLDACPHSHPLRLLAFLMSIFALSAILSLKSEKSTQSPQSHCPPFFHISEKTHLCLLKTAAW